MKLVLRLTWPKHDKPDDYQVWDGDRAVGRMYRTRPTMGLGDRWMWTLYGMAVKGGMIDGDVPHGLEHTREEAMAKFKSAWERVERHNEQ